MSPISIKETNADQLPNEKGTRYKENKEYFYTSLKNEAIGVVITGLFITAAVMVPSVVGAVIYGIIAVLVVITTILHAIISTLSSYREMEENKVEHVNSQAIKI
ncbi:hypothetical protein EJB10_02935 [Wolbachia endosymbiont of Brugia malayi]|uniref:hypothetical protein n=1 Tax=Wolbachia endosymbiont of Brugia malayi TaxID=80849 RepID=UPI00004C92AC|nr:hypothetical protein [Wolbachia endosymbiont of Brugia malayi]AAW70747.1 Predicted protein [Wolbachia endosymbiont strain TRS of Brugia malayi]QCB61725.1 hypothetical protein EJB10_02935 [Wolbachia endosymbiont of Brugia malayi]